MVVTSRWFSAIRCQWHNFPSIVCQFIIWGFFAALFTSCGRSWRSYHLITHNLHTKNSKCNRSSLSDYFCHSFVRFHWNTFSSLVRRKTCTKCWHTRKPFCGRLQYAKNSFRRFFQTNKCENFIDTIRFESLFDSHSRADGCRLVAMCGQNLMNLNAVSKVYSTSSGVFSLEKVMMISAQ